MTLLRQGMGVWLFLAPALIFFVGYQVWPIIRVVWISFTDYQFLSTNPPSWVGLHNYAEGLTDPLVWKSLWRAALFTIMFLPGTIILPLLLAILIDRVRSPRLATIYRVILLIPAFFAGAGIPVFSFASALSYPLSLAGPIVGAWYVIGFGVMVYLMKRRNDSLDRLAESVDPEPTPVLAAEVG